MNTGNEGDTSGRDRNHLGEEGRRSELYQKTIPSPLPQPSLTARNGDDNDIQRRQEENLLSTGRWKYRPGRRTNRGRNSEKIFRFFKFFNFSARIGFLNFFAFPLFICSANLYHDATATETAVGEPSAVLLLSMLPL